MAAQAVDIPLIVSNDTGSKQELRFGLDPSATNGIDDHLGEAELPPFPPSSVFEARFTGADIGIPEMGLGTYRDYREGSADFQGQVVHQLHFQVGEGTAVIISWNLPEAVTGRLQDFITGNLVDESIAGEGSFTLTNPSSINKLKMTVTYSGEVSIEPAASPSGFIIRGVAPNPARATPTVFLDVPVYGTVTVALYDTAGRLLATFDRLAEPGTNVPVSLPAVKLAAGTFIYRITYEGAGFREVAGGRFTVIR